MIIKPVFAAALLAAACLAQEKNWEYEGWSACKIGSWSRLKVERMMGGKFMEVEVTLKLVESTAEKAVLDVRPRSKAGGKAADLPPEKTVLKAREIPAGRLEEKGEEEIEVAGKKLKCRIVDRVTEIGDVKLRTRFWFCDEVPGYIVKSEGYDKNDAVNMRSTLLAWEKKEKK